MAKGWGDVPYGTMQELINNALRKHGADVLFDEVLKRLESSPKFNKHDMGGAFERILIQEVNNMKALMNKVLLAEENLNNVRIGLSGGSVFGRGIKELEDRIDRLTMDVVTVKNLILKPEEALKRSIEAFSLEKDMEAQRSDKWFEATDEAPEFKLDPRLENRKSSFIFDDGEIDE